MLLYLSILIFAAVNLSYAQVPFVEQDIAYQIISGELRALDITTGNYGPNLIAPIAGNSSPFTKLNGGDYNNVDNYIYVFQRASSTEGGIAPNHLIRIGGDGVVQDLGGSTSSLASSGTIIGDNWWGSNGSRLFCIRNISMLTPDPTRTLTVEEYAIVMGSTLDLSGVVKGSKTYLVAMMKTQEMRRFDITDVTNITTTIISLPTMPTGSYGASWTDEKDRVFVCHNSSGEIYLLEDFETSSPNPVLVMTGASTSTNDGISSHSSNPFGSPLPITLLGFSGKVEKNIAHLRWNVADMTDFSHFEIEKSQDAINFNTIAEVEAYQEITDYSFTDNSTKRGTTYYRLKMLDLDGSADYSDIITVNFKDNFDASFTLSPNPVADQFTLETPYPATVRIINPMGQQLYLLDLKPNQQSVFDAGMLDNGIYLIQAISNGKIIHSRKMQVYK